MANKHKGNARLSRAWEAKRNYLEHDGVRDTQTGWSKRLGLSPTGFQNRLALFRAGKIDKILLFRPAGRGKGQVHTKYDRKLPQAEFNAKRKANWVKALERVEPVPLCQTIRVWNTVFRALKDKKPAKQSWSRFFIEKHGLDVYIPKGSR